LLVLVLCVCLPLAAQDFEVFITTTGARYHLADCRHLERSKLPIMLSEALAKGYTACGTCRPPTVLGGGYVIPVSPYPYELRGQVIAIADGDTITLLHDRQSWRLRLNGIDAPESGQDFGQRARQYLAGLIHGKTVLAIITDKDRYGRLLGDIYIDTRHVNAEMVRAGYAWHYKAYSGDAALAALETEARSAGTGLWSAGNAVPPWEYRR
jgi:endonuclease YncB( thermonuclease family)